MVRDSLGISARCIIVDPEGRILFQRGKKDGFYRLPGGKLEYYENLPLCLAREMMEEAGIKVTVGRLYMVNENFYYWRGRLRHEIVFYFNCTIPAGTKLDPIEKHVKLEWRRPEEILDKFRPRRVLEEIMRDLPKGLRCCRYIQTWGD